MAPTVQLSERAFVTKKEIREALLVANTEADRTDDELNTLYNMINWVCDAINERTGIPIIRQTYTEYSDGGGEYHFMTHTPVVSVTSVTEDGTVLTSGTDYLFDEDLGAVRRIVTASSPPDASTFTSGVRNIKVVYVAGYGTQVPSVEPEFILNPAYPAVPPDPEVPEYIENPAYDPSGIIGVVNVPEDYKLAAYVWIRHLWMSGPENFSPEQGVATGSRAAIPYEVKEILINHSGPQHWLGM